MRFKNILLTTFTAILYHFSASCAWAQEKSLDATINEAVAPWTDRIFKIIFFAPITIAGQPIPFILIWLAGTGIFLTFHFKFINLRALG
ncbi:MAG: hypothetical protein NWS00_01470, partial [Opitutales bacterium]|nr:hypothetical protein [Opitutales bacterium]